MASVVLEVVSVSFFGWTPGAAVAVRGASVRITAAPMDAGIDRANFIIIPLWKKCLMWTDR